MSLLRIVPLSAVPATREVVTDWLWQAFGSDNSRDFYASVIDSSLSGADLPLTFVALDDERPVGTVGLWRCDLISRQDLTPWVAALFVEESARGKGLSKALQQHVIDFAQQRGHDKLWLWSTFGGYYERFGWQYQCDALEFPDVRVKVYSRDL